MIAVIGAKENDNNNLLYMLKDVKKRQWLADIFDSDDLTIETLDADNDDIESLNNLNITNTM